MPVAIWADEASAAEQTILISAEGAVPVEMRCRLSPTPIIAPLLVVTSHLANITATCGSMTCQSTEALHALTNDERLVIAADANVSVASDQFVGKALVAVEADPRADILQCAIAFQSLDAIVLDPSQLEGKWLEQLPVLLAGCTAIVVRGDAQPSLAVPWRQGEHAWVMRPPIIGPNGCDIGDVAYAPVSAWQPDLPASMRTRTVLLGLLTAVALGATFLLPRRWQLGTIIFGSLAISVAVWVASEQKPFETGGAIERFDGEWEQRDQWEYLTSPSRSQVEYSSAAMHWPVFADARQFEDSHAVLHWDAANKRARWTWQLPPDARAAFVAREVSPITQRPATMDAQSTTSPLARLAHNVYGAPSPPSQPISPNSPWPTLFLP